MKQLILWCLFGFAAQAAETGLAFSSTGTIHSGALTVSRNGVMIGEANLTWSDVIMCVQPRMPARVIDGGIITLQGEVLRGQAVDVAQGSVRMHEDLGGAMTRPLAGIATIILGAMPLEEISTQFVALPGARLTNGELVLGALTYLNAESAGIDTGKRVVQVPRARIIAVQLRPVSVENSRQTWLQLITGECVLAGGSVSPLPQAVIATWCTGDGYKVLGTRLPLRANVTDRIGSVIQIQPGTGFPAMVGGRAAITGIRLPAGGEAAWDCAGSTAFVGWAVCPRDAEPTIAVVSLGGVTAWKQTLQPGAEAMPVYVPLHGATEIAMSAHPESEQEPARRAIEWGMPTLIR